MLLFMIYYNLIFTFISHYVIVWGGKEKRVLTLADASQQQ